MKRIDKLLAASVLGLAVSHPLAPSVAQQVPRWKSRISAILIV